MASSNSPENLDAILTTAAPVEGREVVAYRVHTPTYEGPLDLLLHLIRRDQIDIYDIPIANICENYVEELSRMDQPDVNLAGEFFVMAATLTYLKSLMLLPKENAEGEQEDPRIPLVAQLLEYEKFKKAAQSIDGREWLQRDLFPRPESLTTAVLPKEALADAPLESIESVALLMALKTALTRTHRKPIAISTDKVSLSEKIAQIREHFEQSSVLQFDQLLPMPYRVPEVIVSFLCVLELAKLGYVEIFQHEIFGPIQIRARRALDSLDTGLLDQF